MTEQLSDRELIRASAERFLAQQQQPLHYKRIAESILPQLNLTMSRSAKDVNNTLHEDKRRRFVRLGKGMWGLAIWRRA